MSEEELKKQIEKAMIIEAPDDFTSKIMDKIAMEKEVSREKEPYQLPGKNVLIMLLLLFSASMLWGIFTPNGGGELLSLFGRKLAFPPIEFDLKVLIFNKMTTYIIGGLSLFILIDYLLFNKKVYQFH